MRVVQIINHFGLDRGGAERLAFLLHCDLLECGVDAHLLALEPCLAGDALQAKSLGFASPRDPRALIRLRRELRLLAGPGTVIHAHLFPATLYVAALRRMGLLREPCSMTEHSTWNRRRRHPFLRQLDNSIYGCFNRIVAVSDQTRGSLLDSYPTLKKRTQTILNGTELHFAQQPERIYDPEEPCFLSLARLARPKNLDTVLQALARLKERPWRYVIAGQGPDSAILQQQTQNLGIADKVEFLGQVRDVKPLLRSADIFLMPSRWEGFGLAAVEAMNAGLPVVASTAPGLREVVCPAGNPTVDPDDIASLTNAITNLLDDPAKRARLGAAGFSHAGQYDKLYMTRRYLSFWSDMAGNASK